MKIADFPGLPKWPGLLVAGKKVRPRQAAQIIIRTLSPYLGCNDRLWNQMVRTVLGFPVHESGPFPASFFAEETEAAKALGVLDLPYLYNSRIMSSWIGGPKGWVDWDGTVFANHYNIGKWPTVEEVRREWRDIAGAFPFLDLTAQLLDREAGEEGGVPLVEFRVKEGSVWVRKPKKILGDGPRSLRLDEIILGKPSYAERGCTREQLVEAVEITRKAMARRKR